MTFSEVVAFYFSATSHRSKDRDGYSFRNLAPAFAARNIVDIRRVDVRAYINDRQIQGITVSTIKRELRFASAAVNLARVELEKSFQNPFQSLKLPEAEPRVRWIERHEASQLIQAAGYEARTPHLQYFIILALHTGCRCGELLSLEWSRVDLLRRFFRLEARHTKSARRRAIPLNSESLRALEALLAWRDCYAPSSPWVFPASTPTGHIQRFKAGWDNACKRVGIEDFRIHDLRHTCASWLVMADVSLYVIRDLLGHSSITVTERYAHLSPDKVAEAVRHLEFV